MFTKIEDQLQRDKLFGRVLIVEVSKLFADDGVTDHLVIDHNVTTNGRGHLIKSYDGVTVLATGSESDIIHPDWGQTTRLLHGCNQNVGVRGVFGGRELAFSFLDDLGEFAWHSTAHVNCLKDFFLKFTFEGPRDKLT